MITAKITAEPTTLFSSLVFSLNCRELNKMGDIKTRSNSILLQ